MKKYLISFTLVMIVSLGYSQKKEIALMAAPPGGEDCIYCYKWNRDVDHDGFGDPSDFVYRDTKPAGYVANQSDLDDANPKITNIPPQTFYQDADNDTFGNPSATVYYSVKPAGYVTNNSDCNDGDASLTPNTVWYRDADGDGFGTSATTLAQCSQPVGYVRNSSDYNDTTVNITNIAPQTFYQDADNDTFGNPSATLYYSVKPAGYVANNGDCNDSDTSLNPNTVWYRDADGDGFGTSATTLAQCSQPAGYVRNASDYNDSTGNITNIAPQTFYQDTDNDTFGNPSATLYYSVKPAGYVANNGDCNDSDTSLNPNTVWYRDADGDGFGTSATTLAQCSQPAGYVRNASDYNDSTGNITNIAPQTFYQDADNDTFGNPSATVYYSVKPAGYVTNNSDCNDSDGALNPNTVWYRDADGDGFGTSATTLAQCSQPAGYVRNSSDYNDTTINITNIAPQTFYRDADNDTFGNPSATVYYSVKPAGYVANNGDCNDSDTSLNPNTVWYRDADGDTFGVSTPTLVQCTQPAGYVRNSSDYNDTTVNITNIAPQTFYRDSDADTFGTSSVTVYYSVKPAGYVTNSTDCNDTDATLNPNTVWYRDADGDTFGVSTPALVQCTQPAGYVRNSSDYNDTTVNITNIAPQTFYRDADADTFGTSSVTVYYSVKPAGYVTNSTDCNDTDATLNPNTVWYRDADGDTFGVSTPALVQCSQPTGYVRNASDYNDSTGNITNIAPQFFYEDADGDTYGNPSESKIYSVKPAGYVSNNTDCNDADATLNPNTKWYADNDVDGLGNPSSFIQQCTKPGGNYVSDNTDNCPFIRGSATDCENVKAPSLDQNYIITTTYKEPTTTVFVNPSPLKAQVNITYFDGLGRPMQQIANQQSGSGKDIITHIGYDDFGRQTLDYLPFASTTTNMVYDQNASANTLTFYNTLKYENIANPFSEKKLESSPLSRVLKQAAPGTDWVMDGGHEIKLEYQTNTDTEVRLYKATVTWNTGSGLYDIAFSDNGDYSENQLYKNLNYDENTAASPTESAGSTVEFKNKEGQVVLKRTYEAGAKHDTYYVYDSYGNLTYVIPPKADVAVTTTILNDLCYQYKYDYRNRLVEKKLPGKQWEFIVYDKLDRPVATGPSFSPFKDDTAVGWLITKYDAFSRPIYTGWNDTVADASTRKSLQDAQNGATVLFETKQTSGTIDGIAVNYSNAIAPTSFKLLTVNYYDDYVYPNAPAVPTTIEGQTVLVNAKSLSTGSWTRTLTIPSAMHGETAITFYDPKARPIRSYITNYLGGYTYTDSKIDFTGKPLYTLTKHKRTPADAELSIKEEFTYSPQDRLLTHTHQINGGTVQLMAANTYDELGQLTSKKVGNNSIVPLQKVDYSYNIRGWLTEINKTDYLQQGTDPKDLFGFKINYNTIEGKTNVANKLYNGNIAETFWSSGSDGTGIIRAYGYKYDQLNRLKDATYQTPTLADNKNYFGENMDYDKNGNITRLQRKFMAGVLSNPYDGDMDNLGYFYDTNSNQLMKVTDSSNETAGFKDDSNGFNDTVDDYGYDINGNMIKDDNKGISLISYNHLNLPKKITFGATGTIDYIYNAAGQKLEKIVNSLLPTPSVTTTDYLDGFQYKNTVLQFFPMTEGYFNQKTGSAIGVGDYVFNYTDHLGNIRLSYSDTSKNGIVENSEIIEESNYYPFGLKHKGYNDYLPTNNKYKYNGKEFQDENIGGNQLNLYDYGARNYDPALGRWMTIDPKAENSRRWTPYNYAYNSPMYFVDPDGMQATPPDDHFDSSGNFLYKDFKKTNNIVIHSGVPNFSQLNDEVQLKDFTFNKSNYSTLSKIANHYTKEAGVDLGKVHNGSISVSDAIVTGYKGGQPEGYIENHNDGVYSPTDIYGSSTIMNQSGSTITVNLNNGKVDPLLNDANSFTATLDHEGGSIGHLVNPEKKHTDIYKDEIKKYSKNATPEFKKHLSDNLEYYKKRGE
ncbi:DUF6443 domain-containing protein [Flavobacterium hiemivividum]|nr:DUF6443 domain-containing protein [Flavobacterium hiemivividum]